MGVKDVRELVSRIGRARTVGLAAEMSFWLFLALIPLAVVAGLVAAKVAVNDAGVSAALAAAPAATRDMLAREMGRVAAWNGGAVAPTAIVVFVWLASSGVHSVFDAMELETGCARPWWKKRAIAIGGCVLLSVGIAAVALLEAGLGWVWRLSGAHVPVFAAVAGSIAGRAVRFALGALVAFGITSGLFVIGVPKPARTNMPIFPGAALAVVLEGALVFGYAFYVSKAGAGGAYEAGLAAIGVTMTALYLFSLALLVGLELNVILRDRRGAAPACAT